MKLDRWKFTRIIADPLLSHHTHTGQHRCLFSLLDFIPLCPYYWMEMISILGKFFVFAFAFFFTVLYYDPRIMANPGLAFVVGKPVFLDWLQSLMRISGYPLSLLQESNFWQTD